SPNPISNSEGSTASIFSILYIKALPSRIACETATLYGRMLDSWCTANQDNQETPSLAQLVAARK
ncbi:hypothetical protein, partial [Microcoleus sp. Pol12A5]|uniref:hypothetical protein n=1 Tax=Microcoleus sp. Pol12A5 TaxID=3055392 RepID=UPI002FD241C6